MSIDAQGVTARWRDSWAALHGVLIMETVGNTMRDKEVPRTATAKLSKAECRLGRLLGDAFKDGSCGLADGVEGFKE